MRVHVLNIRHDHGSNVYVCKDERCADAQLFEYVRENWGAIDEPIPDRPDAAIDRYFDTFGSCEWYEIFPTDIVDETNAAIRAMLESDLE